MIALILTVLLVAAIPLNLWVAVRVFRIAWVRPRNALLVLLSRLTVVLALLATVLGLAAINACVFLWTGLRLIPTPIPTGALVGALLLASGANVLVWRYLWARRAA